MQRLGIDIGSKTLKLVLLDEDGTELFSSYQKHRSRVAECLRDAVHALAWRIGDREVSATVTGSSGMRLAEVAGIPFVQEVVALKRAVLASYPEADAVLEMGGEDTKLVYLTGAPEQRMNNICAGGTGSFIEMMGGLMGARTANIDRLAMGYTTIYPIASRCAVFAKSDVRPLLNAGARREDIAASVLDAVCTQAVAGLSAGRPLSGTVLLLGGPFQHITALREAFCRVTGFDRRHAVVPKDAHLFVARGAAMSPRSSAPMMLSELEGVLSRPGIEVSDGIERLRPLFASDEEREAFRERHRSVRVPRVKLMNATKNLFLGIDAGSTTAKLALIDETGALVAYDYHRHRGDVVDSLSRMMKKLYAQMYGMYAEKRIVRRSCAVGYGEELCRAAFGIDGGEVETVAHLRAALALEPAADFVMDIGGQDVKCFYIRDGAIQDVVINEACSSGCGSLFDSVSKTMGRSRGDFVGDAMRATAPVDLGTRCTTFMNSRIRHAQKEGASAEDIAAGVCYATARNALFKVVRQPDFSKVGKHVVVQGGAFGNDALLRAFELETGAEVIRPDLAPVMGAWGAALLARDEWLAQKRDDPEAADAAESGLIDRDALENMDISKKVVRCEGCTNRCELRIARFAVREADVLKRIRGGSTVEGTERILVAGNRCERGALLHGVQAEKVTPPPNMMAYRRALIASYDVRAAAEPAVEGAPRVGVPKALALYGSYPFWVTLLSELGLQPVAGSDASDAVFRKGMASIPAEGMCYPAKLAYGQAADLAACGADVLLVPAMGTGLAQRGLAGLPFDAGLMTCPLVENAGDMLAGNAAGSAFEDCRIAIPDLRDAHGPADVAAPVRDALAEAGIELPLADVERAVSAASAEYRSFLERIGKRTTEVLARIDAGEFPGALLVDHSYHAAEGVSHGVDGLLGELGYAVLERTGLDDALAAEGGVSWYENADAVARADACAAHSNLHPIVIRSFGCGIDAMAADGLAARVRGAGGICTELKLDQIADLATVRIRLRSLAYAHRQREGATDVFALTAEPEAYRPPNEGRSAADMAQATKIDAQHPVTGEKKRQGKQIESGRDPRLNMLDPAEAHIPDKAVAPPGFVTPGSIIGLGTAAAAIGIKAVPPPADACFGGLLRGSQADYSLIEETRIAGIPVAVPLEASEDERRSRVFPGSRRVPGAPLPMPGDSWSKPQSHAIGDVPNVTE